jgi:hypothetical protein
MKRTIYLKAAIALVALPLASGVAWGQAPRCARDMTRPGSFCLDRYEASVWRVPDPAGTNKSLVKKIAKGTATAEGLVEKGATQLGLAETDDYAPCSDSGQTGCDDIFAVSIAGVPPSANLSWFQAQQACANSAKRLPRSGEWQQAVAGTPDTGGDNGSTDCKTTGSSTVSTGSRGACVSRFGNYDMVGNVYEWVEDWVPQSTGCPGWGGFSNDFMCLSGASTTATFPGALTRGGSYADDAFAGPLLIFDTRPQDSYPNFGFRCAR